MRGPLRPLLARLAPTRVPALVGEPPSFTRNNFDLLRLFAALQVMLFHAEAHFGLTLPALFDPLRAFPGVPIFFVTSGYLISASYERSGSVLAYAAKRALRLLPALWVCLLLTALILLRLGYPVLSGPGLAWLLTQMLGVVYTPGFLKSFGFGSYNGSLWTIPLEIQFYLTLPLLHRLAMGPRGGTARLLAVLAGFVALTVLARAAFPSLMGYPASEPAAVKLFRYSFVPHYFTFLAGVLLFRLRAWTHPFIHGQALPWAASVLLFAAVSTPSAPTTVAASLLLAGCTLACAYTRPGLSRVLGGTDISYGIYIYHGLVVNLLLHAGLTGWPALAATLAASPVLGLLSWHLVERPALGLKHLRARRTAAALAQESRA